jgi:hypothetical protein
LIGLARHAGELNDIIAALKSHKASRVAVAAQAKRICLQAMREN